VCGDGSCGNALERRRGLFFVALVAPSVHDWQFLLCIADLQEMADAENEDAVYSRSPKNPTVQLARAEKLTYRVLYCFEKVLYIEGASLFDAVKDFRA